MKLKKTVSLKDRIGEKYGYVTIIDVGYRFQSGKKRGTVTFKCECGNVKTVLSHNVLNGRTKSCGCKESELKAKASTKHGLHNSRIYQIYYDMLDRCSNINNPRYHRYGGRGITVCDEWQKDFMNFYKWAIENGYTDELTIERINNDGNYCPKNCKWATMDEQLKNRDLSATKKNGEKFKKAIKQIDTNTGEVIRIFNSVKEAREITGTTTISQALTKRIKTAGGYKWEYVNEEEK